MIEFQNEIEEYLTVTCQVEKIARGWSVPEIGVLDLYLPDSHLGIALYTASVNTEPNFNRRLLFSQFNELPVIHLWEDQWRYKREIISSRLLSRMGKSKKIHARQTDIRTVDTPGMLQFLAENHLQVPLKARFRYGLFFRDELVALAAFSKSRPMQREGVIYNSSELVRFCSKSGHTVVGGLSKLIAFFIAKNQPDDIMTYRDTDWPGGKAYHSLGFEKAGLLPPFEMWLHERSGERHYPHRLMQEEEWKNCKISMVTDALLASRGYSRVVAGGSEKLIKRIKKV